MLSSPHDANSPYFVARVARAVSRAYMRTKESSTLIKYCVETILESPVRAVLGHVIKILPSDLLLDEFVHRRDRMGFYRFGLGPLVYPIQEWETRPLSTPGPSDMSPLSPTPTPSRPGDMSPLSPVPTISRPGDASPLPPTPTSAPPNDGDSFPEVRERINGGFVIPYAVGVAWFERKCKIKLNPDHREDLSVLVNLDKDLTERGLPYDIEFAHRTDVRWNDFLLVTQWISGPFTNLGVPGSSEVTQDDLKDILKPGEEEEEARKVILREYGIELTDFKCYFYGEA